MSEKSSFSERTPITKDISTNPEKKQETAKKIPETLKITIDRAVDVAMKRVIKKINFPEGLKTDPASYCREVMVVLGEMDKKLPE